MTRVIASGRVESTNGSYERRVTDITDSLDMSGKYVNIDPLMDLGAEYVMCFSGRSDGKTTSALSWGIRYHEKTGRKIGLVRRWADEMVGTSGENQFNSIRDLNRFYEYTGGEFDGFEKYGERWYYTRWDEEEGKHERAEEPFCYGFALNTASKYKSSSFESVGLIVFDEFISPSNKGYLKNEDGQLLNLISTIVRNDKGVPVVLLGNTLNRYNPYFEIFDMKEAKDMPSGSVYLFEYWVPKGDNVIYTKRVAYYSNKNAENGGKDSDAYFMAMNSRTAKMITLGEWEKQDYPNAPEEVNRENIAWRFYVEFDNEYLEGLVVSGKDGAFLYFRDAYTLPYEVEKGDVALFTLRPSNRFNFFYDLFTNQPRLSIIGVLIRENRVFFETDDAGELFTNYLSEMRNVGY